MAAEGEDDWGLCPVDEAVPAFADAPAPGTTGDGLRTTLPTDIIGDALDGTEQDQTVFQGNVALSRGDQFLGTDRLTYDSERGTYVAEGSVRYQDDGMRVVAERAEGNQEADTHRIENLRYQLTGRRGSGRADRIELTGDKGALIGSTYSTCPPSQRAWELRAQRIDIDSARGEGTARNATVRIGRVPVLYVPWIVFPTDDRRRTGLLYPALSSNGRNGLDYRQPIYLNLAPNYDATITPRLMSKRGAMLGGEFRWLYPEGRGRVSGAWMPSDQLPGNDPGRYVDALGNRIAADQLPDRNRGQLQLEALHNVSTDWHALANIGWVSDRYYLQDFSNSLFGVASYFLRSEVGLFGRGRTWEAAVSADYHQLADFTLTEGNLPFDRLPRMVARWNQPFGRFVQAGVDAEAVRFGHEVYDGGSRLDVKPYVAFPLEGASWYVTPRLAYRHTSYQLEGDALSRATGFATRNGIAPTPANLAPLLSRFADDAPSRNLPITSVDAGMYFDRDTTIRGTRYLHTLEPRLYYLNVPFEDQDAIPLFDTLPMTFSWGQLFRDNRYTGADRQTDANQLTTALSTRLISEDDGRERLSASLGFIQYFDDSRVVAVGEVPVARGRSAWITDVSAMPSDRWMLNASYQWDPKERRQDLASVRARYLLGDSGIVNFGYRYRRDLLEQADLSFLYPLNPNWSLVGRYYYSIDDRKLLESIAGVQWESCCLAVRVVARRFLRNRTGELNDSLQVEFELKGLGSAGQNAQRVLRRSILGYDRDDLYLVPPSSVTRGQPDRTPDPTQ